ncbi:MAG: hypothetical protein OXC44_01340 [Proteobacteria bacterium]|nr:hypothetical protein [Pseudomonadota bacterium]
MLSGNPITSSHQPAYSKKNNINNINNINITAAKQRFMAYDVFAHKQNLNPDDVWTAIHSGKLPAKEHNGELFVDLSFFTRKTHTPKPTHQHPKQNPPTYKNHNKHKEPSYAQAYAQSRNIQPTPANELASEQTTPTERLLEGASYKDSYKASYKNSYKDNSAAHSSSPACHTSDVRDIQQAPTEATGRQHAGQHTEQHKNQELTQTITHHEKHAMASLTESYLQNIKDMTQNILAAKDELISLKQESLHHLKEEVALLKKELAHNKQHLRNKDQEIEDLNVLNQALSKTLSSHKN